MACYKPQKGSTQLLLPIPLEAATNKAEVDAYEERASLAKPFSMAKHVTASTKRRLTTSWPRPTAGGAPSVAAAVAVDAFEGSSGSGTSSR